MSATSPSPNSPPSSSGSTPPTPLASLPPSSPLPNANPPEASNSTVPSPPPQPPLSPPVLQSPPPAPPLLVSSPPPPSPQSDPSAVSPPPPLLSPPDTSPPPPLPVAPKSPPQSSPPPPRRSPPPPTPEARSPVISPPPPATPVTPENSPPPPSPSPSPPATPVAPEKSPPSSSSPQPSMPARNSPPPPRRTPPPKSDSDPTPPPANSPPESSPSPPVTRLPPLISPAPPSLVPVPPSSNETPNNSSPGSPQSANSNGNGGIGTGGAAAIAVVASIVVLSLIGLAFWCVRKQRKKISGLSGHVMPSPMVSSPKSDSALLKAHAAAPYRGSGLGSDFGNSPRDPAGLGNSRPFFTFEELVQATNGFSNQNLLGEGGFGSVFKGYLPDGREIAVKQLKIGGGQGEREFQAEVEIISRIHHRHLVSLVGYCISDSRRLLVYEYVPNNNLYFHLHGEGQPVLEWATRVRVAAGSARGIAYLHEDCHPRIIHRDIKSSNILLDNNYEARVSDFGLAKLALEADTHITTRVMGTFGYVAPEYASSGKLTDKSDVYSFGVVLLELITGRKPVDASQPLGDESLVEWARPLLSHAIESGEYDSLVDPKLEKNYTETEMLRMVEIAAACVRHSSAKRPRMGQVVRAFDSLGISDLTNGMRVGESEVFNSAQQSEEIRWFRRMAFGSRDNSTDFFSQNSFKSRESRENGE